MTIQVAPNAYSIFRTPPRLCRLPPFPMAPRLDRRLSLPPIAVLVDSLDDSDDDLEENILSYHSRRFKTYEKVRGFSQDDDLDYLEKRKLVFSSNHNKDVVEKKNLIDTGKKKWDFTTPLSPLSDLTESEASDSDDDLQFKPTSEASKNPPPTSRVLGLVTPSTDADHSTCSNYLKRKRSSSDNITTSTSRNSDRPSKRRCHTSKVMAEERCAASEGIQKAYAPPMARHPLAMSDKEVKRSIRRNRRTFGTVRKPMTIKSGRGAGSAFRPREWR